MEWLRKWMPPRIHFPPAESAPETASSVRAWGTATPPPWARRARWWWWGDGGIQNDLFTAVNNF